MSRLCKRIISMAEILFFAFAVCGCKPDAIHSPKEAVVLYRELKNTTVPYYKDLPATVSAILVSEARPQVTGIIKQKHFEEGSIVKAGDFLFSLDSSPYQAAYDRALGELFTARADLDAARKQAERSIILNQSKAISKHEYESAQAELARIEAKIMAAEGALQTTRIELERSEIRAPISGRIGRSNANAGMLVTANQEHPLAVIQQFDPIYVDAALPEKEWQEWRRELESGKIKTEFPNQLEATIWPDALFQENRWDSNRLEITASASFLDLNINNATGAMLIRASFPNPSQQLLPGMWTMVRIKQGIRENAIVIPQRAICHDKADNAYAYVLERVNGDNQFRIAKRNVKTGRVVENGLLVEEGLKAGDLLVVEGFHETAEGQNVTGIPEDDFLAMEEKA